jgi:hypothetical protein
LPKRVWRVEKFAATIMPLISSQTHVTARLIASGLVAALGVFGVVPSGSARELLDGHWEGAITQPAGDLRIAVDLKTRDDVLSGTFDAPWVAAFRWPLTISSAPPKPQFENTRGHRLRR